MVSMGDNSSLTANHFFYADQQRFSVLQHARSIPFFDNTGVKRIISLSDSQSETPTFALILIYFDEKNKFRKILITTIYFQKLQLKFLQNLRLKFSKKVFMNFMNGVCYTEKSKSLVL
jgi:hypothetical protein